MRAHIPVDTGYETLSAPSDGANPVTIEISDTFTNTHRRFVNAFALKDGVIDPTVEISGTFLSNPMESVTFTPPDSDTRIYLVIVMG